MREADTMTRENSRQTKAQNNIAALRQKTSENCGRCDTSDICDTYDICDMCVIYDISGMYDICIS